MCIIISIDWSDVFYIVEAPLGGNCENSECGTPNAECKNRTESDSQMYCDSVCICKYGYVPSLGPFRCGGTCIKRK